MKKAMSLILAIMMVFALSTTAFAANVIGTRGVHKDFNDGVDAANAQEDYEIAINVSTSSIVSKYAVDVEYSTAAISLGGGTLTWDVNTMTYVTTDAGENPTALTKTITITNYSDKAITAYATIEKKYADDGLTVVADYTSDEKLTVDGATPGVGDNKGTEKTGTITITLGTDTTWADVVTYYTNLDPGADSIQAATATVSIAAA